MIIRSNCYYFTPITMRHLLSVTRCISIHLLHPRLTYFGCAPSCSLYLQDQLAIPWLNSLSTSPALYIIILLCFLLYLSSVFFEFMIIFYSIVDTNPLFFSIKYSPPSIAHVPTLRDFPSLCSNDTTISIANISYRYLSLSSPAARHLSCHFPVCEIPRLH